ncbi:hypothetical protein PLICBS_005162 [Purpureocillium lilacinum]|uniref:uncharacterized protein n=1 Tax=Purpureocillium lilacinum TaxID=33203 RepID=UPI0020894AE5|nr:hypothetical protein PLICBS_005162 [Purpureocillium lilacinum]
MEDFTCSPEWRRSTWSRGTSDFDALSPPGNRGDAMPPLLAHVRGGPQAVEALMSNWFDQVCPAWSAFDSPLNPNRKIALELMHSSASVFNALRSMSASFLSARLPQLERPALQMLRTAALSITEEAHILRTKPTLDAVPTGLLFSLFCLGTSVCWLDAGRLGLPFLKEAKDILSRLSGRAVLAADDQLETLAFFKKSLVYWEMLLSFVDDYQPERAEQDFQFSPSPAMQEVQEAQKLEQELLELDFSSATPTNNTGDEKTPWMHLAYVAEAYQLASLLQIYLTFPDLVALRLQLDPDIETSTDIPCDRVR